MVSKNSLKEDTSPQESINSEATLGTRKWKSVRVILPGGQEKTFLTNEKILKPGDDGVYEDIETIPMIFGHDGNPVDLSSGFLRFSWTNLPITSPEQLAICTSRFHRSSNRNVLIGVDGSSIEDGQGICNECQRCLTTIYIVAGILGCGLLLGLIKACGTF